MAVLGSNRKRSTMDSTCWWKLATRHDDAKRPKVQLSKRSERKTQSTRSKSPFLSFPSLFPSSSSFSRRQKLQASVFLSLSLTARRDSNGMAEITRICFSPLLSLALHDIPLDRRRRQKKTGCWITWMDTESERSVAFKRTVYSSVKMSLDIVSLSYRCKFRLSFRNED